MPALGAYSRRCKAILATAMLIAALAALPVGSAPGQPAAPEPTPSAEQAPATDAQLEELLRTLEDPQEREQFLANLRSLLDASRETEPQRADGPIPEDLGARVLSLLSERVNTIGRQLGEALTLVVALPEIAGSLWEEAQSRDAQQRWLEILVKLALVLAAGLVAEWILARLLARPRQAVQDRAGDALAQRILLLLARALLDILPIIGFAAASYIALSLSEPREATRLVVLALVNANVIARAVGAVARLVLTPEAAQLRLVPANDETAHYVYIWVRRLTAVTVYGYFFTEALLLLGLAPGAYSFVMKAIGLLVAALLVVLIMQNRAAVADWLRGHRADETEGNEERRGPRARLGEVWHVLAIAYVAGIYGVWALEIHGGFEFLLRATVLTIVILAVARFAIFGTRRLIERGFRLSDEMKARFPGLEVRTNHYLPLLLRILRVAIYILAGLALLEAWGLGALGWLGTETGREIGGRLLTILLVMAAALLLWELVSTEIESYLKRKSAAAGPGSSTRLFTLLPLMRNAARVVLGVIVVMVVLSEVGVDIAPLLAGAGVVGLAVGFGAQTLVKDVITGIFILLEESVRVGDVVDLGGHVGIVEGLTIRTIVLRDLEGVVHVVPFGEVASVSNMTMGFAFALLEVGVAYREDVDEVIAVLQEIGAELQADETFGPEILEPLEVLGLDSFGDSSVNIRIRFKTQPIKQWMIKREFNRRMKRVFDERGIEIPFPHRTVYFGVDKEGKAPPARVLAEGGPPAGKEGERAPQEPGGKDRAAE